MNAKILVIVAAGLGILAVAFAIHFELSARTRAYHELRGLRRETTTDLDHHRISPARAATLKSRLQQARLQIEEDNVRGAQKVLDGVRDDLGSGTRSA